MMSVYWRPAGRFQCTAAPRINGVSGLFAIGSVPARFQLGMVCSQARVSTLSRCRAHPSPRTYGCGGGVFCRRVPVRHGRPLFPAAIAIRATVSEACIGRGAGSGQRARRAGGLVDGAVSIWCLLALSPGSGSGPAAHHYWSLPRRLRIGLDGDERGTQSRGKARFPSTILPAKARDLTATARRLRPLRLAAGDRIQGRAAMARC